MLSRRLRPLRSSMLLLLTLGGAFAAGRVAGTYLRALRPQAAQAQEKQPVLPVVGVQPVSVAGLEGGRLIVGDDEIALLAVPAGGFSGYERALVAADRLNRQLQAGVDGFEVRDRGPHESVETAAGVSVLSVTADDARQAKTSSVALARRWVANLSHALAEHPVRQVTATAFKENVGLPREQPASVEWSYREPYSDRYVPVLSLLEGTRAGVARVNGPRSQVALVRAVAHFSIVFGDVLDINIYVPIAAADPRQGLARVQGVGATGLGDVRL